MGTGLNLSPLSSDGALVRLITPVYEREKLEDAEARLQGFIREIVAIPGITLGSE